MEPRNKESVYSLLEKNGIGRKDGVLCVGEEIYHEIVGDDERREMELSELFDEIEVYPESRRIERTARK